MLDVLVDKMRGQGPSAHQVWLPPLDVPPTLDQLMPNPSTTAYTLACTVGIADEPLKQRRLPYTLDFSGAAGHAVIVGGPRTGKSTLVRAMLLGLAFGHTLAQVQFFGLDFGGGTLASLSDLPHTSGVGGRLDEDLVRRIVSEVVSILDKREESFRRHGIDSIGTFRARRARGALPDEPFGDVFLVIDGWSTLHADFPQLESDVLEIAQRGLGFGVHVVITAARWPEIRPQLKDAINTRIELRLGEPAESVVDRRVAANVPADTPGRGLTTGKLHFLAALPRVDGIQDAASLADGVAKAVHAIAEASQGLVAPRVRMLPLLVRYADLPAPAARPARSVPLGVDETKLEPVYLDFDADPHFLLFGEGESGKSSVLRTLIQGVVDGYTPRQARVLAVDYRRSLLEYFPESHKLEYCAAGPATRSAIISACDVLRGRLPGLDVTAQQLRNRSWWTGAELFVVVDDYDLVADSGGNPLAPLAEFLPMARDVGLHLIIARASGGASRALFDPFIQRLRETRQPGLILSGERDEGPLLAQARPSRQPPGRGTLVSRRHGSMLIQTAYLQSTE